MAEFSFAGILERIHHRLFQPDLLQMSGAEAAMQNVVNRGAQVFRGGNVSFELWPNIKILVVESLQHLAFDKLVEIYEVANHSGARVNRTADRDLKRVVVSVAVGVVALAVSNAIFLFRHLVAVQAMGGGKHITASEVGFHGSP